MKIPQKNIDETIIEIAGKEGLQVYKILKDKENVNEFSIAEKLKLTINQIRNLIYKFEQHNLVTSTRKKDRKKGWYIYFFTLNPKQLEDITIQFKEKKVNILQRQLDRESSHDFYTCPNKCMRLPIENAMEHQFMCSECGSLLEPENKENNVTKVKKLMKGLEEELKKLKS